VIGGAGNLGIVAEALNQEHLAVVGQGSRNPDSDRDGDEQVQGVGGFNHGNIPSYCCYWKDRKRWAQKGGGGVIMTPPIA
jgi:hypothetical protein